MRLRKFQDISNLPAWLRLGLLSLLVLFQSFAASLHFHGLDASPRSLWRDGGFADSAGIGSLASSESRVPELARNFVQERHHSELCLLCIGSFSSSPAIPSSMLQLPDGTGDFGPIARAPNQFLRSNILLNCSPRAPPYPRSITNVHFV